MEILNYIFSEQDLIGKGGMGSVYRAKHKFIEGEMAAVKVINANMITDFTRQLLKQEAANLSSLNHPNIVQFKNYHIDEQGNVYLIMEYVDGLSLDQYIRRETGLIVESRICPIFEPILDAVGYAHKRGAHGRGIMHLDIKPANIIIKKEKTSDGEEKIVPKILDFGIAQIIKTGETQNNAEQPKLIMGTPSYMSPEQTKGEQLDSRSDIYSLGVVLHQMMIGRPPYDTTTLSEFDINRKVMEDPLPRIKSYYEQHSARVQKVIDKATAKDRKDRYQTCEEFKKALHDAVYPPKVPVWAKTSIAAAIAIIIGVGGWFWDYNRVKVSYYKDYVEQWGVPVGIGKLTAKEHSHSDRSYRFEERRRKLIRVSHVNSLDNLIDDGESERNERPVDQEFYYTAEGKVSRINVLDRSGKVLYVKSYNDKLNVMAFQYNDEHNTERVLSNSTVGYGRLLESNDADRGRISRWWIEYDENGFVNKELYHGLDNSAVGDKNGIYGRSYVRDEKGRPIEIHYLGIDGQPQSTSWGLGIKKFVYDEKDNWIKAVYQTVDEQVAYDDSDGIAIFEMEYDDYGNVIAFYHKDGDGKPMCPKKNYISGGCYVYDDKGMKIRDEYWDMDLKPMFIQNIGAAILLNEYDENGYVSKTTYCDPAGNIVNNKNGNAIMECKNDEHGNVLEVWYKNSNGEVCETTNGFAGIIFKYDSLGNQTRSVYYGKEKEPIVTSEGYAGLEFIYDELNRVVDIKFFGKDFQPTADINNIVRIHNEYDKRGNNTKVSFFEADGQTLRLSSEGIAGWEDAYDEQGNHLERKFFDEKGAPIVSPSVGYAVVRYTYDENEHLKSIRYLDANLNPILVDGKAGYDYVNDKRGNVLEEKPIGKDGNRASGWLIRKSKYDQYDNCIEWALFDDKGPATNNFGVHRKQFAFNSRNQQIEERCYGKDGKLIMVSSENYAIQRDEFDDKGDRVKTSFFGTDEKPCLCKEGWSSTTREYNAFGKVIKQCFFGLDGKPTDPKVMVPVGICEYDKWGNMIYLAAQDGKGNFINKDKEDWSINRMEYDQRNNCISMAYYSTKDTPTLVDKSFHKWIAKYDNNDNLLEKSYFGVNDEPVLFDGYHKVVYKYDENTSKRTEEAYFGKKGDPVLCKSAKYHKMVQRFNVDRQPTFYAEYNAKGGVISKIEYTYDSQGRILSEKRTDAKGGVLKAVYSYKGDESEPVLTKIYDGNGNLLATMDSKGNIKPVEQKQNPEEHRPMADDVDDDLQDLVDDIQKQLPMEIDDTDLIFSSVRKLGGSTIELIFIKKSQNSISADEITGYKIMCNVVCEMFGNEFQKELGRPVTVKYVLKDNKGNTL